MLEETAIGYLELMLGSIWVAILDQLDVVQEMLLLSSHSKPRRCSNRIMWPFRPLQIFLFLGIAFVIL